MRNLLQWRGFADDSIAMPAGPTVAEGQRLLLDAVRAAEPDDLVVIYFSGHGWFYPEPTGGDNGYDECLIFSDGAIPDDWAGEVLWPAGVPGVRYVVIVDACHSETALKRIAPPPDLTDEWLLAPPQSDSPTVTPRDKENPPWWRVYLSACGDEEITKSRVQDNANWSRGGLTTTAMNVLLRNQDTLSYQEMWTRVARRVHDYDHEVGAPRVSFDGPDQTLLDSPAFKVTWGT